MQYFNDIFQNWKLKVVIWKYRNCDIWPMISHKFCPGSYKSVRAKLAQHHWQNFIAFKTKTIVT